MIYRITISTGRSGQDIDIYAHPAWPHVIGSNGDPSDDFKVIFVQNEGSGLRPAVYMKSPSSTRGPASIPPSKLFDTYQQLMHAPPSDKDTMKIHIVRVQKLDDLTTLG
jgi:hypothetical protein